MGQAPALAVVAGPGTGKTKTLTARILHLLGQGAAPGEITAVTFTRRAAGEMEERLAAALGGKSALRGLTVATFHAICHDLLGRPPLLSREEALALAEAVLRDGGQDMAPGEFLRQVSQGEKQRRPPGQSPAPTASSRPTRRPGPGGSVLRDGGQDMAPGEFLRQLSQVKNSAAPLGTTLPPELFPGLPGRPGPAGRGGLRRPPAPGRGAGPHPRPAAALHPPAHR